MLTIRHDTSRIPRPSHIQRTRARIRNAERAVRREMDSVPLFPELARFTTAEQRLDYLDDVGIDYWKRIRSEEAARWRRLRRRLLQLEPVDRDRFLDYWNNATMLPAEAGYALEALFRMFPRRDWYVEDRLRIGAEWDTPAGREQIEKDYETHYTKGETK